MTAALTRPTRWLADAAAAPVLRGPPGAPDRWFASLDDRAYRHQVARLDARAGGRRRRARRRAAPAPPHPAQRGGRARRPRRAGVGHLHGTELLMLEQAEPGRWPHLPGLAGAHAPLGGRLRAADRALASHVERVERLLGIDADAAWRPERLRPRGLPPAPRRPGLDSGTSTSSRPRRAGRPARSPAPSRYDEDDLAAFAGDGPVLLYVGRFTAVKRLALLIEAYARARPRFARPAPLVHPRRLPGRVGGRAPAGDDPAHGRRGRLPRRLARPRRAAGVPLRGRRGRPAQRPRAVRPGARGGDGLRPARDRRRRVTARRRSSAPGARAGWSRPTTAPASAPRSPRPSTIRGIAPAAARRPRRTRRPASPGPRWPDEVAEVYDDVVSPSSRR